MRTTLEVVGFLGLCSLTYFALQYRSLYLKANADRQMLIQQVNDLGGNVPNFIGGQTIR